MRDLLLLGLLPVLVFYALTRPFIGLSLWLWTSLVPMQTWAYGPATSIRWNMIFALCTMLGYLFQRNKPKVKFDVIFTIMCIMLVIASLSSFFHTGYDILVFTKYEAFVKSFIFFVFVFLIVDKKLHVQALMWACVLSITATAAKQGVKVFFSGGSHVVYGMSSTFNDNNLSAFATLVCIPLTLFLLHLHKGNFVFRWGLIGAVAVSAIFVLGSDSRGGFLGLLVLGAYYFWNSKHKVAIGAGAVVIAAVGLSLLDAEWFERMQSIKDADQDSSFMGRVIAWKLSILLALESPLLGGGFDAVAYRPTWEALMSNWQAVSFIPSPYPEKGHVAHSIYFQVLGDLGFLAFFLYFGMFWMVKRRFDSLSKLPHQEPWLQIGASYFAIAMVCFFVAGAALSVAYNEIVIMLSAVAIKLSFISQRMDQQRQVKAQAVGGRR